MSKKQNIELNGKAILVTGSPGFIGANLVIRLLTAIREWLSFSRITAHEIVTDICLSTPEYWRSQALKNEEKIQSSP